MIQKVHFRFTSIATHATHARQLRRSSTGSEAFSHFICLDAKKFVLLSFFAPIKTIYRRVWTKPLPNDAKSPLSVDVHRSKTLLLNLPIIDNNKELVMPNTAAQNVGQSHQCFVFGWNTTRDIPARREQWLKPWRNSIHIMGRRLQIVSDLFRSYGTTTSTCRCPFLRNRIFNWRASPKWRNTKSSTGKIVNNSFF